MPADFVYLASGSPRRRELLEQIGVPFRVLHTFVDEATRPGEAADAYVARLAAAKAEVGWAAGGADAPVLAADTAVVLDGRILGKPVDRADGRRMLADLSGRTHRVLTGVALRAADGLRERLSSSEVTFRDIRPAEAEDYWSTGEPHDKAGAYAVQGLAAVFISQLRGSYSGVMGLPLYETAELLEQAGVPSWRRARTP